MKKILTIASLLILVLMLSSCAKIDGLSAATKIHITRHSVTSDDSTTYSATVISQEQVEYICNNLSSLKLKKMEYNKPTMRLYTLEFYTYSAKLETISITAHGWIDYNGDFYTITDSTLDTDYIDSLLSPDGEINPTTSTVHTGYNGIYLTLDSVETIDNGYVPEYKNLSATWHNETDIEVSYEPRYFIEYADESGWISVQTAAIDWITELRILPSMQTQSTVFSTEGFDLSKPGTYRVRQNFKIGNATYHAYFEFVIIDSYTDNVQYSEDDASVKLMQYRWDMYGVSTKTVTSCDLAYSITDALESATETGETVAKISSKSVDESSGQLPVEPGTMWIEAGGKIYRTDPSLTQLCRVDKHLGKGKVLNMSDELRTMLANAWHYHPYDYHRGTYTNKTDTLELEHVYASPTAVQIQVQKLDIKNEYHPTNSITLELYSKQNIGVTVSLDCYRSDDDLAAGDYKEIFLEAGVPQTVELTFGGWSDSSYWITVTADNTRINLKIEP